MIKVGDLVRYTREARFAPPRFRGGSATVGLVFELHLGREVDAYPDIVHVRMLDGTEVVDSDHFFEVLNESR